MSIKKGDTIIEVVFAISIFGFVSIVTLNIMQKAMMAGQLALETSLARQAMDSQAEALRFLASRNKNRAKGDFFEDNIHTVYKNIKDYKTVNDSDLIKMEDMTIIDSSTGLRRCTTPRELSKEAFVIDVYNDDLGLKDNIKRAKYYPRLVSRDFFGKEQQDTNKIIKNHQFAWSEGIYVQAIKVDDAGGLEYPAIDFHIKACWETPSSPRPVTLATIVRLYDD